MARWADLKTKVLSPERIEAARDAASDLVRDLRLKERQAPSGKTEFDPDRASPPGETIEDLLGERGWTRADFAARMEFDRKQVGDLMKGRMAISPELALHLELVLGVPTIFWLNRESRYREALERRRSRR
jgi:plasmid maintenance system antidote protein VapI